MIEKELAQEFVKYLSCYDLYFEVDYGRSVDIVALTKSLSMSIEVKTTFNFKVLDQAISNKPYYHYSYIAVPYFKDSAFQEQLCKDYGVGLLIYKKHSYSEGGHVMELVRPKINRNANYSKLFSRLSNIHKLSLPGTKSGDSDKITAFGVTVENAIKYVNRHSGCSIKEMVENIAHHYRSNEAARANIYSWIRSGVIKGLIIENKKMYTKVEELKEVF